MVINIMNQHSKIESQLIIHIDTKTCGLQALPSLSHQGTPTPDNSSDASSSTSIAASVVTTQRQQHGPSEYELRREANIAENKQLLASLGLSEGGSSAILGKPSTNEKRKKGEKGKAEGYVFLFYNAHPSMI